MEEVKKNLKKNGLVPEQVFNSAASKGNLTGKIAKEEIKNESFLFRP